MSLSFPPINNGNNVQTLPTISPFIQQLFDDLDASAARQTLGFDDSVGYDIFLLAGQSNMVGWGTGYDPLIDLTDSRIKCWPGTGSYLGRIVLAQDPLPHRQQQGNTTIGPAMTFAREYLRTIPINRSILLVCAASNGSTFQNGDWNSGNPLHAWAVAATNQVLSLDSNNRLVAILWLQGESDVLGNNPNFQSQLDAGLTAFRSQITGAANVPIITGDFSEAWVGSNTSRISGQNIVRQTQSRLTNVAHALGTGTTGNGPGDENHFSATDCRTMGLRYFNAFRSLLATTPPGVVSGLSSSDILSTGFILSWSPTTIASTDYRVAYRVVGATSWELYVDGNSEITSSTITGLSVATNYEFRVAGINSFGTGSFSNPLTVQTLAAGILPGVPSSLSQASVTASSISVSWNRPLSQGSTPIIDYSIRYSLAGQNNWQSFTDGVSLSTSGTVTGLAGGTSYDIQVAAINSVGIGVFSQTLTASTSSSNVVLTGLQFYYRLDNDFSDTSGNNPTSVSSGTPAFANIGGRNGVLDVRNGNRGISGLSIAGSYSKSIWIYTLDSNQDFQNFFSAYNTGDTPGHYLALTASYNGPPGTAAGVTVKASHRDTFEAEVGHSSALSANTWHHIALTYDSAATTMRLYVNNVETSTNTNVAVQSNPLTSFALAGFGTTFRLNGYLDNARLYNRAITAAEVQQIYSNEQ